MMEPDMLPEQSREKGDDAGASHRPALSLPENAKEIVGAWFVTVINPLIEQLKLQNKHLEKRRYTWSYYAKNFDVVEPLSDRIQPEYAPNLEHFTMIYSDVGTLISRHSEAVALLQQKCVDLQHVLERSAELERLYNEATSEPMLVEYQRSIQDLFGRYPLGDHLAYLAQLIINHTGKQQEYFPTHPLWNRFGEKFIDLLTLPAIRGYADTVDEAADQVRTIAERLLERLQSIRMELAHAYGIPFVPLTFRA